MDIWGISSVGLLRYGAIRATYTEMLENGG
jgi:hypothetical protein